MNKSNQTPIYIALYTLKMGVLFLYKVCYAGALRIELVCH